MKQRFIACLLTLSLLASLFSPAWAAGNGPDYFPALLPYAGFSDVAAGSWYEASVKLCCETDLMKGTGAQTFSPGRTVTVAEIAAIAARLREALTGEAITFGTPLPGQTVPWYQWYVDDLKNHGLTGLDHPNNIATRADFIRILAFVLPDDYLPPINSISALPDTENISVLKFYNAGILTGTDEYGTFGAGTYLSRAETAVILSRIVRPELRKLFIPQEKPAALSDRDPLIAALGFPGETPIATLNGEPVPAFLYSYFAVATVNDLTELCEKQGTPFSWSAHVDVSGQSVPISEYVAAQALSGATQEVVIRQIATAKGIALTPKDSAVIDGKCAELIAILGGEGAYLQSLHSFGITQSSYRWLSETDLLYEKLKGTFSLSGTALTQYIADEGYLRAKHILVADQSKALSVHAALLENPSLEHFEACIQQYSEDPQSNPNGYLFRPGEMVPEFEAATASLAIGGISQPVKSAFGYHIILRLDPTPLVGAVYCAAQTDALIATALHSAKTVFTPDSKIALPALCSALKNGK